MFTTLASRTIPRATLRALPRAVQVEAMPRRFNSQSAGGPEDPAEPSRNVRPRSERKAEKPALVKAKFAELAKASNPSAMVNARFRDVKGIDPKLVKAIPFQHCSEVGHVAGVTPLTRGTSRNVAGCYPRTRYPSSGKDWNWQNPRIRHPCDTNSAQTRATIADWTDLGIHPVAD